MAGVAGRAQLDAADALNELRAGTRPVVAIQPRKIAPRPPLLDRLGLLLQAAELLEPVETKRRIAVMRPDRHPSPTEWRPRNDRYLFQAEHVADVGETIRRWLDVWHRSVPSLGLLAETIEQGRTYSAPRFLTLYTAAETYYKASHAPHGPWSLRSLAAIADIDPSLTCATKDAVALIGRLRNYHAHGAPLDPGQGEQQALLTYDAIRRLQALLQVCVMRDLGMPTDVIEERMAAHYRAWPLP